MTTKIIFPNLKAAQPANYLFTRVEGFKGKITVEEIVRTYPNEPNDQHVTMTVTGREKDIHAVQAVAWIAFKVQEWKPE